MVQVTKTQLNDLFEGGKSYEEIAVDFSASSGMEISEKMVREMFKANGFNLRNRKRKAGDSWFTVVDDTTYAGSSFASEVKEVDVPEVMDVEEFA